LLQRLQAADAEVCNKNIAKPVCPFRKPGREANVPFGLNKLDEGEPAEPGAVATIDEVIEELAAARRVERAETPDQLPEKPAPELKGCIMVAISAGDGKPTEISSFADAKEAQSFIERMLARGTDRSAIAAFRATPLAMKVAYRPIVNLLLDTSQQEAEQR
jgi:hypothetical protein